MRPPLDPRGAGHLAVAVERVPARRACTPHPVASARQDRGDAGAYGSPPDVKRAVTVDECHGSDFDARDVGDRVERPRLAGQGIRSPLVVGVRQWCASAMRSLL